MDKYITADEYYALEAKKKKREKLMKNLKPIGIGIGIIGTGVVTYMVGHKRGLNDGIFRCDCVLDVFLKENPDHREAWNKMRDNFCEIIDKHIKKSE